MKWYGIGMSFPVTDAYHNILRSCLACDRCVLCAHFQNGDRETALHSASQFGHLETVALLLEHHADPNIKNSRDETPLDLAALYGRYKIGAET